MSKVGKIIPIYLLLIIIFSTSVIILQINPVNASNCQNPSPDDFGLPSGNKVNSPFGPRVGEFHWGIDYSSYPDGKTPTKLPFKAGVVGHISDIHYTGGYNTIDVDIGNGYVIQYLHASTINVSVNDPIYPGTILGNTGNTAPNSVGIHLHVQVRQNGNLVDPTCILLNAIQSAKNKFGPNYLDVTATNLPLTSQCGVGTNVGFPYYHNGQCWKNPCFDPNYSYYSSNDGKCHKCGGNYPYYNSADGKCYKNSCGLGSNAGYPYYNSADGKCYQNSCGLGSNAGYPYYHSDDGKCWNVPEGGGGGGGSCSAISIHLCQYEKDSGFPGFSDCCTRCGIC